MLTSPARFLLVARTDHTTRSRNITQEIVFKVQEMARYASFCLIMGPLKGEVPVFARLWPVRVSFTTGAVRSAILATAVLLVTHSLLMPGTPVVFQSRVGKHLFDKIRLRTLVFSLPILPYVAVAHLAHHSRPTLVLTLSVEREFNCSPLYFVRCSMSNMCLYL